MATRGRITIDREEWEATLKRVGDAEESRARIEKSYHLLLGEYHAEIKRADGAFVQLEREHRLMREKCVQLQETLATIKHRMMLSTKPNPKRKKAK